MQKSYSLIESHSQGMRNVRKPIMFKTKCKHVFNIINSTNVPYTSNKFTSQVH